jgi:hypothetical protein
MSNIEEIVDVLELKISKTLRLIDELRASNLQLEKDLTIARQEIEDQKQLNSNWKEKYETLKITNGILGSDDSRKETKFKINALIRDIDHCIAQLAD